MKWVAGAWFASGFEAEHQEISDSNRNKNSKGCANENSKDGRENDDPNAIFVWLAVLLVTAGVSGAFCRERPTVLRNHYWDGVGPERRGDCGRCERNDHRRGQCRAGADGDG